MIEFDQSIFQSKKDPFVEFFLKKTSKHIIPIASGKGGVGKTTFTINLGIHLAKMGKNPVIIDLDLGSSNLHTYLGLKNNNSGIAGFLSNSKKSLSAYKCSTETEGLEIIPGDQLIPDMANVTRGQKKKIMEGIFSLPNDYIILDLGAGANSFVTDFFLLSSNGIILTEPTHGAVLNAFSFLKTVIYRLFKLNFKDAKLQRAINKIKTKDANGQFPTFWDILNDVGRLDKRVAVTFKKLLDQFKPSVVFNMVESVDDIPLIRQLISLIYKKLILDIDLMGYIPKSAEVRNSVKQRKPLSTIYPNSKANKNMTEIAEKTVNLLDLNQPLFDLTSYDTSMDEIEEQIKSNFVRNVAPPVTPRQRGFIPPKRAPQNNNVKSAKQFMQSPFDFLRKQIDSVSPQNGMFGRS